MKAMDLEKQKRIFSIAGLLLQVISAIWATVLLLLLLLFLFGTMKFGFDREMLVSTVGIISLLLLLGMFSFLGKKIEALDRKTGWYILIAFLLLPIPAIFGKKLSDIVVSEAIPMFWVPSWIPFYLAAIISFVKIFQLKRQNLYNSVFEKNMDKQQSEDNQVKNLDKAMKGAVILGIILIASSVAYYFFYRPYQKEVATKHCHQWASNESKDYYGKVIEKRYSEKFEWCMNEQGK